MTTNPNIKLTYHIYILCLKENEKNWVNFSIHIIYRTMGQYYVALFLGEQQPNKKEIIRMYLSSPCGIKLMEHSYLDNPLPQWVEYQLSPKGMMYKTRLVWAGDYAGTEPGSNDNLYAIAHEVPEKTISADLRIDHAKYPYIVNHSKKEYIDKRKLKNHIHPLPILTSEGNGRGGGDYRGSNEEVAGTWARDVLSVEANEEDFNGNNDYQETEYHFRE